MQERYQFISLSSRSLLEYIKINTIDSSIETAIPVLAYNRRLNNNSKIVIKCMGEQYGLFSTTLMDISKVITVNAG